MYKKLSEKEWESASRAIQRIAQQEGKTVEEVRKDMKLAMLCGLLNNEPQVQEHSVRGEIPGAGRTDRLGGKKDATKLL